jgi:aminoglycoside phosphotransferase (APT) family kinase protein
MLKLPRSDAAIVSQERQKEVLTRLHNDQRLGAWRDLLPTLLAEGETANTHYLVEQMKPGFDARTLLDNPDAQARVRTAAATAIGVLHRHTASAAVVDAGMLERWIDEPLCRVKDSLATLRHAHGYHQTLDSMMTDLHSALVGKSVPVSWVHGDFTPGNILLTADAGEVTGILDWDQASPEDLPQLDLVLLFLSMRMLSQRRELGDIVGQMLKGAEWTANELDLLNAAQASLPGETVAMRELVLLAWLRHVAANLSKSTRYVGHRLWTAKNIEAVLLRL